MTPFELVMGLLTVVSLIFFIWGTAISSIKYIGIGGILLTSAFLIAVLERVT